jgi:RNA polymerase sigma factor (sigma-70 family)
VSREGPENVTPPIPDRGTSEDETFRSMFELRYPSIYSYVLRRLGPSSNDVVDVTSQIFAVAWSRRGKIPAAPGDLPWLYGVARKIVSRHWRTVQRRQRLDDRLTHEAKVPREGTTVPDPEVLRVREAIDHLSPKDQEVLKLVFWEGLSHAEAGEVLGCSANAVAIRLHKARQRLRDRLDSSATTEPHGPGGGNGHSQEGSSDGS